LLKVFLALRERLFFARLIYLVATVLLGVVGGTSAAFAQATSTDLASFTNPSTVGHSVTIVATVNVTGAFVPGGTVELFDGATSLGTSFVGAGQAIFSVSTFTAGSHTLTAVYGGDGNGNQPSTSAPLIQNVLTATTTSMVSSVNPSTPGQSVTFTATVNVTGAFVPTGTIEFFDGATSLGTRAVGAGQAALSTSTLTLGSHSITAIYSGDSNNGGSSSTPLTQNVNQATTTTGVVSSVNPSTPGQSVTFTATVTGASPTGTVQFK
jgi:hypothetical protein